MEEERKLTREARWRQFEERWLKEPMPRVPPKPKPKLEVKTALSPKMTEAVKVNPASLQVRVSAEAADGTTVIERARQTEIVEVLEVDGQGRPSLARRLDCTTNEWSLVEYYGGYRPSSGVVHEYNPLAALRRD
jgi:hypothetical protein